MGNDEPKRVLSRSRAQSQEAPSGDNGGGGVRHARQVVGLSFAVARSPAVTPLEELDWTNPVAPSSW